MVTLRVTFILRTAPRKHSSRVTGRAVTMSRVLRGPLGRDEGGGEMRSER